MASGYVVGLIQQVMPPGSSYATNDWLVGGSTPAENIPVFDFDASSDEYLDFICYLTGYAGGGLTVDLPWSSSTTTGDVRWEAAIRRIQDDGEDVDTAHTYDYNAVTDTAPGTVGYKTTAQITFSAGSDMDSLVNGEQFILRVHRDYDHVDDDMAADAELWMPVIKET